MRKDTNSSGTFHLMGLFRGEECNTSASTASGLLAAIPSRLNLPLHGNLYITCLMISWWPHPTTMQSLCKDLGTCHLVALVAKTCEQDLLVITPCLSLHVCFGVYGVMGISLLRSSKQPPSTHTQLEAQTVWKSSITGKLGEAHSGYKKENFSFSQSLEESQGEMLLAELEIDWIPYIGELVYWIHYTWEAWK